MATETTFASRASGRLPGFRASGKVPGPGVKVKFGTFTIGTSEYPDDGYTAADLAVLVGFTSITAIIPTGPAVNGSGEGGTIVGWDSTTATLRLFNVFAAASTETVLREMTTNSALADSAKFDALIIGY